MTSPTVTAVDLMRVLPAPFGLAVGDAVVSPAQGGSATRERAPKRSPPSSPIVGAARC